MLLNKVDALEKHDEDNKMKILSDFQIPSMGVTECVFSQIFAAPNDDLDVLKEVF